MPCTKLKPVPLRIAIKSIGSVENEVVAPNVGVTCLIDEMGKVLFF
jgi:hypothetical protein